MLSLRTAAAAAGRSLLPARSIVPRTAASTFATNADHLGTYDDNNEWDRIGHGTYPPARPPAHPSICRCVRIFSNFRDFCLFYRELVDILYMKCTCSTVCEGCISLHICLRISLLYCCAFAYALVREQGHAVFVCLPVLAVVSAFPDDEISYVFLCNICTEWSASTSRMTRKEMCRSHTL